MRGDADAWPPASTAGPSSCAGVGRSLAQQRRAGAAAASATCLAPQQRHGRARTLLPLMVVAATNGLSPPGWERCPPRSPGRCGPAGVHRRRPRRGDRAPHVRTRSCPGAARPGCRSPLPPPRRFAPDRTFRGAHGGIASRSRRCWPSWSGPTHERLTAWRGNGRGRERTRLDRGQAVALARSARSPGIELLGACVARDRDGGSVVVLRASRRCPPGRTRRDSPAPCAAAGVAGRRCRGRNRRGRRTLAGERTRRRRGRHADRREAAVLAVGSGTRAPRRKGGGGFETCGRRGRASVRRVAAIKRGVVAGGRYTRRVGGGRRTKARTREPREHHGRERLPADEKPASEPAGGLAAPGREEWNRGRPAARGRGAPASLGFAMRLRSRRRHDGGRGRTFRAASAARRLRHRRGPGSGPEGLSGDGFASTTVAPTAGHLERRAHSSTRLSNGRVTEGTRAGGVGARSTQRRSGAISRAAGQRSSRLAGRRTSRGMGSRSRSREKPAGGASYAGSIRG